MTGEYILFVEDDAHGRELGIFNLRKAGYGVDAAATGEEGLELFDAAKHELVITDLRMPGISGMDLLRRIREQAPDVPVLVITAYASVEGAVEAMKAGAIDFVGKPFNREHLLITVRRALDGSRLRREVRSLRIRTSGVERPIVHRSKAMGRVIDLADRVAESGATVLVTGESGTGKELVARRIHVRSDRAEGPFVAVSAAAMPAELLEAELFGHERGAFTGAVRDRPGRFRQADGGTLFLDEVGELPTELQGKLLRALQEKVVDVLGSDEPRSVDVRVVAATNRDLAQEIATGRFREDLYYRLNVVEITVPPLRDRPEDIELLARHFVALHAGGRELEIPDEVLEALASRRWPGNVRELENACQRAAILAPKDRVRMEDLPVELAMSDPSGIDGWPSLPEGGLSLVDLERHVIERVLVLKDGNVTQAAAYLGIPRHVLAYRMQKYGIERPH